MSEAILACVETLNEANIPATANPQRLDLPGAYIMPNQISFPVLAGTNHAEVILDIVLIGRGLDLDSDIDNLDQLALEVSDLLLIDEWSADTILASNYSPDPLPALVGQFTYQWKKES